MKRGRGASEQALPAQKRNGRGRRRADSVAYEAERSTL